MLHLSFQASYFDLLKSIAAFLAPAALSLLVMMIICLDGVLFSDHK